MKLVKEESEEPKSMKRGSVAEDVQRLRTWFDEVMVMMAASPTGYGMRNYAFNEIGRTLCSIIDRGIYTRASEPSGAPAMLDFDDDVTRQRVHAACIDRYVDLGFEQVNVCVHLRRWAHGTALPSSAELAERGWAAVPRFDPSCMFIGWSLVDLYSFSPEDANEAARHLAYERPDFDEAHARVAGYAGLEGAPAPLSCPQEAHYELLFGHLCTLTEIAVSLMHRLVDQWKARERLGIITSLSDFEPPLSLTADDDDRPKSDEEAAALTRRQSGITLPDSLDGLGRDMWRRASHEAPLPPVGLHGSIERATFGHNGRDSILALGADDPTICLVKRRAKVQDWFRKRSATVRYDRALPVSAFRGMYNAVAFANRQGLVMNVRVGVSWYNLPDCPVDECKGYFAQFKKNLVQWFASAGLKRPYPAIIFVHERAKRANTDRFHTHMMLAVPETMRAAFTSYVRKALLFVLKRDKLPKRVLWVRWRKVPNYSPERRWPITRDQWTTVTYMLKGVDPAAELGLNVNGSVVTVGGVTEWGYEEPGEPFAGEPWGWTETLGPGMQKRFGDGGGHTFRSLLDWQTAHDALDWRELYTDFYLDQSAGRCRQEPPDHPPSGEQRQAVSTIDAAPFPDPAMLERLRVALAWPNPTAWQRSEPYKPGAEPFREVRDGHAESSSVRSK